mgnify:CR=1 FL=1
MTQGMQWGIFSLLAILFPVLGGMGAFFLFLATRAARFSRIDPQARELNLIDDKD